VHGHSSHASLKLQHHTLYNIQLYHNSAAHCRTSTMSDDAPKLHEITQLTRQELTTTQKTDPIRDCGRAALSLFPNDAELCLKLAYQKLHDVPYKEVKTCWRRLYADASLWKVLELVEGRPEEVDGHTSEDSEADPEGRLEDVGWVDEVVRLLDMTLILSGAPNREELVELWFAALKDALTVPGRERNVIASGLPAKRRKLSTSQQAICIPACFPINIPEPAPNLRYSIPRTKQISHSAFQKRLSDFETHTPLIIEDAIQHWPAHDERPWNNPWYLLGQTLGGRRLIPVEIGKSYTDEGWGQRIMTFRDFMEIYMLDGHSQDDHIDDADEPRNHEGNGTDPNAEGASQWSGGKKERPTGYLAQHDLFAQIPSLRADISIPDYCYCDPAPSPHLTHIKPVAKLEEPLLNAWFGPAGTISPLHTDPYHNILAQVVGYKYVRLYAPSETTRLHPRSFDENGVDMSNTSQVDLVEAMAVYPEMSTSKSQDTADGGDASFQRRTDFEEQFPGFKDAKYIEAILAPGECLYLPVGWWHYIRSFTPSFSVSFWFN
jgi:hypothetical protein